MGKSESLFPSAPKPQKNVEAEKKRAVSQRREEIKKSHDDYLFKGEKDKVRVQDERKLMIEHSFAQRFSEAGNVAPVKNRLQRLQHASHEQYLRRFYAHKKRHYNVDGDFLIYVKVKEITPPHFIFKTASVDLDLSFEEETLDVDDDEFLVKVLFKPFTFGVKNSIDCFAFESVHVPGIGYQDRIDDDAYAKLAFVKCFKSWNIDVPVEFENNRVSDKSMEKILNSVHPVLFSVIAQEFIRLNQVTSEEHKILEQQSKELFGENSQGVSSPVEGIRSYCETSLFYKEFGLGGNTLKDTLYRDAMMIKEVAHHSNEEQQRQLEEVKQKRNAKSKMR